MIRLRFGKRASASGAWPGGASEITAPRREDLAVEARARWPDRRRRRPPPRTASVIPPAGERAAMGRGVDPARHPADHHQARRGEQPAELLGDPEPVRARPARADDGHGLARAPARRRALRSPQPKSRSGAHRRRGRGAAADSRARLAGWSRTGPRRRSIGAPPPQRQRLGTWSPETRSEPSRSAIVRESRSTRSCPRPLRPQPGVAVGEHRRRPVVHRRTSRAAPPGSSPRCSARPQACAPGARAPRSPARGRSPIRRGRRAPCPPALGRSTEIAMSIRSASAPLSLRAVAADRRRLAVALAGLLAAPARARVGRRRRA